MKDKLLKTIKHYGLKEQLKHFYTEIYELTEAIIDYENLEYIEECDKKRIASELADNFNFLFQFMLYYDIPKDLVKRIMEEKMDRQSERMKNEPRD